MKIKDIKTEKQFYEFADVWYQRVHKLRRIFENKEEAKEKRDKAQKLYLIMFIRVMELFNIAKRINVFKPKHNKGGIAIVGENKPEVIIRK